MALRPAPSTVDTLQCSGRDYVRQYNADLASRWDELIDWDRRAEVEGDFFVQQLLKVGACRIFDAATGSGFHAVQLRKAGFDVMACDGSAAMVDRAKANFARRGLYIPIIRSDWRDLDPQRLDRFDAVLCLGNSICHLFEQDARIEALQRFRRLLRPGGVLLIDQRNFRAILNGRFPSSVRCADRNKTVPVTLGEVTASLCEFVYTFADGARHTLRVFPLQPEQLRLEMRLAGFGIPGSFGDLKHVYDPMRVQTITHEAMYFPM